MGDADRRIGGVHVLTAGTAGPISVDFQIVRFDLDFNFLVHLGIDKDGSE